MFSKLKLNGNVRFVNYQNVREQGFYLSSLLLDNFTDMKINGANRLLGQKYRCASKWAVAPRR